MEAVTIDVLRSCQNACYALTSTKTRQQQLVYQRVEAHSNSSPLFSLPPLSLYICSNYNKPQELWQYKGNYYHSHLPNNNTSGHQIRPNPKLTPPKPTNLPPQSMGATKGAILSLLLAIKHWPIQEKKRKKSGINTISLNLLIKI